MSSHTSLTRHRKGPDVLVRFFVAEAQICRVDLLLNAQIGLAWQIYSESTEHGLENVIEEWMDAYAKKQLASVSLPLYMEGIPPFTFRVLDNMSKIPFGSTLTYQELGSLSGNDRSARAVGNACARNPFPLIIPCHRVLKTGNALGGFSSGLEIKSKLLAFEGVSAN